MYLERKSLLHSASESSLSLLLLRWSSTVPSTNHLASCHLTACRSLAEIRTNLGSYWLTLCKHRRCPTKHLQTLTFFSLPLLSSGVSVVTSLLSLAFLLGQLHASFIFVLARDVARRSLPVVACRISSQVPMGKHSVQASRECRRSGVGE